MMQKTEYEGERQHLQRVTILGAGVSGLVLGWMLAKNGWCVRILEKEAHCGGMAARKAHICMNVGDNMHYSIDIMIFMPVY